MSTACALCLRRGIKQTQTAQHVTCGHNVAVQVGGLSVINAIAGAYSENLPVICIVGRPSNKTYITADMTSVPGMSFQPDVQ